MNVRYLFVCIGCAAVMLCVCHRSAQKDRIARVGSTLIRQQDFDAFNTVVRYFPNPPAEFSLASRPTISAIVETEAIFRKARWNPKNLKFRRSLAWQWKDRYFTSLQYTQNILQMNLGFSDKDLKKYYETHKEVFTNFSKVDSTGKACSTKVVRPFDEVKMTVAEKLFLAANPPDSAFKAMVGNQDTAMIRGRWVEYIRERAYRDFFMKAFFKEKYGKPYPDSLKDLYGDGKPVTKADMDIILSWLPDARREQCKSNPQSLMDFSGWLMKWKLFSEKAVAGGYAAEPPTQKARKWAWKLEIAQRYITERIVPKAKKDVTIDTAMALYSYWDDFGSLGMQPDTGSLNSHRSQLLNRVISWKYDSLIYRIRLRAGVRFLQTDWKDDKVKNPALLLRQADSLRDTGKTSEAQNLYLSLTSDFPFTKEGKKALVELAKIQTEQQSYMEAVKNYRLYLVAGAEPDKRCNTMFMIGFIYDEYLERPEMAEVNYRWVLKNAPDCELADDAEFMMLHLGEQMSSVEELQAEVRRQGKKVDASNEGDQDITVDTAAAPDGAAL